MINWLHSHLHRPERGWDPVDPAWATYYGNYEWEHIDAALLDAIGQRLGGWQGKRILDIGAGAGQYAVTFAQRGADAVWYDISRTYLAMAQARAADLGVTLTWQLGYLDEARTHLHGQQFDFIFNRGCWFYCHNDRRFARMLWEMLAPGGLMYVYCPNNNFHDSLPWHARLRVWLNATTGYKIGHPMLPPRHLATVLNVAPWQTLEADFRDPRNDAVWVAK